MSNVMINVPVLRCVDGIGAHKAQAVKKAMARMNRIVNQGVIS